MFTSKCEKVKQQSFWKKSDDKSSWLSGKQRFLKFDTKSAIYKRNKL